MRSRAFTVAVLVALAGCHAQVSTVQDDGGTPGGVTIHGRIFDLESCPGGCMVVVGAVVSLHDDQSVVSSPTGPDGAFALADVPRGTKQRLRAETTTGMTGQFVTTVNANEIELHDDDVFGVELYLLSAVAGDLLGAIATESGRDLRTEGGYVGEVIRREPEPAAVTGASVELFPADFPMRYVNVIPRYVTGEPALQPNGATGTSGYGLFVVAPFGDAQDLGILVHVSGLGFDPLLIPMAPGVLVFGLHVGTSVLDGGTPVDASTVH
jgi:hypothetical protein